MRDVTCVSVCDEALRARRHFRRRCRGPARSRAPVSSSQLPAAARPRACSASTARSQRLEQRLERRYIASTCADCRPGPARRGRSSSSTSPTLASNTSPKLLTSCRFGFARPTAPPAGAPRSCTRRRFGQSRRTTAWRTQGTASNAARAAARSTVKKLPASRGATLARRVDDAVVRDVAFDRDAARSRTAAGAAAHHASAADAAGSDAGREQRRGGRRSSADVERQRRSAWRAHVVACLPSSLVQRGRRPAAAGTESS